MDRETLGNMCRAFAARHDGGFPSGAADPVPEILRSFRLAEISAGEMRSLLGLVADDPDDVAELNALESSADEEIPPGPLVADFPDFDALVASGEDDEDDEPFVVPARTTAEVRRRGGADRPRQPR